MQFLKLKDIRQQNHLQLALAAIFLLLSYLLVVVLYGQLTPFFIFTAVVLFLAIILHPEIGIYLMIFGTFIFEKFFTLAPLYISGTPYKIYFLDFILIFTVISVIFKFLNRKWNIKEKFKTTSLDWYVIIFVIFISIVFARSLFIPESLFSLSFSAFKNYAVYAIVYFLVILIFNERKKREELANFFLWAGVSALIFIFIGMFRGEGLWVEITPLSTSGARLLAGTHALYTLHAAFLVISILLSQKVSQKTERAFEIILWITALGFVVALVRHLWLSEAILGVFMFWYVSWQKRKIIVKHFFRVLFLLLGSGAIILLAFSAYDYSPRFVEEAKQAVVERLDYTRWIYGSRDSSVNYRQILLKSAFNLWVSNPIMGVGLGRVLEAEDGGYIFAVPIRDVHNNYLEITVQGGVVGLIILALWILYMLRLVMKNKKNEATHPDALRLWSIMCVLNFLLIFNFSFYWNNNVFVTLWWLSLAIFRLELAQNKTENQTALEVKTK